MAEVSFVIATRNRAALIAGAIESVGRLGNEVEVIVVDDASTDATPEVCKKISGIRYLRLDSHHGTAGARNLGVRESDAEFVAFLDDDDLRLPDTIGLQIQALKTAPEAALVYGRVLIADSRRRLPTGRIIPQRCPEGDVFWELLEGNFIPLSGVVARRECLVDLGLFRSGLKGVEDWDLWLRLSERHSFKAVEEPVAIYRRSSPWSDQVSSGSVNMFKTMLQVQDTAMHSERARSAPPSQRDRIRRALRSSTYEVLVYEAAGALAVNDKQTARNYLQAAVRLCPFRVTALWWLLRSLMIGPATGSLNAETLKSVGSTTPE